MATFAIHSAAWFQKQEIPFTTLDKLAQLSIDNFAYTNTRILASSGLAQAVDNGQKVWESRLIVESLKKASIDSNKEIRDNALKALSNIIDQSKNFTEINESSSNFKEINSFYNEENFRSIHKSFDQGLVISKLRCGYS